MNYSGLLEQHSSELSREKASSRNMRFRSALGTYHNKEQTVDAENEQILNLKLPLHQLTNDDTRMTTDHYAV
jgi:hypothetical protein